MKGTFGNHCKSHMSKKELEEAGGIINSKPYRADQFDTISSPFCTNYEEWRFYGMYPDTKVDAKGWWKKNVLEHLRLRVH